MHLDKSAIFAFVSLVCAVDCFNFDTEFPIVYTHPNSPASYFGFSVILHQTDGKSEPWVQIGAPKGKNPLLQNETTGVVLRCGIKEQCRNVPITLTNNGILKNAFFGNSMDITDDGSKYAVCGHRWIYENTQQRDYYMQGACQWSMTSDNDAILLTPFKDLAGDQVQTIGKSKAYKLAQGQAGFSAQFTKYGGDTELLLGAPGVYNWHGVPMIYRSGESDAPVASRLRARAIRPKSSLLPLYANVIPSGQHIGQTNVFDLLGYAVTSGYFFDNKRATIYYAASAPKFEMRGKVLIFTFKEDSQTALNVKDAKVGTQFGEYYGGSLTAVDVNNDKFDDLIVGAPFHKDSKYDEGRIYVLLGGRQNSLQDSTIINGKVQGGRFGQAVMSLGDKDFDGYNDVAVAAPYEGEGSGVVYIYRGKSSGLEPEPVQKLIGKDFVPNIQAFGSSLSKPADIDSNGNDDLAIGAFLSGHTVLLRSKPAVILKQTISSVERLDRKEKSFQFVSCVSYHGESVFWPTYVARIVVADENYRRVIIKNPPTPVLKLQRKDQQLCENITATLKDDITNLHIPLTIKVTLHLVENKTTGEIIHVGETVVGNDKFCMDCPILNPYQSLVKAQLDVPFSLGCGEDNKCEADLRLTTKFLNLKNPDSYIIGSQKYLTMETNIQNLGENAYSTDINVLLPSSIRLRSIPSNCIETNSSHVVCNVGNPLEAEKTKVLRLEFDMEEVNSGLYDDTLNFRLEIKTSSDNLNQGVQEKPLMLTRVADVTISGKSKDQSYSYGNITHGKSDFVQLYKIQKFGDSPIGEITWEVNVPTSVSIGGVDITFVTMYPPQGSLNGQPINCHSNIKYIDRKDVQDGGEMMEEKKRKRRDTYESEEKLDESKYPSNRTLYLNCSSSDIKCEKIVCTAGPFRKQQNFADLQLMMKLDISNLADYLNQRDIVIVSTSGKVVTHIANSNNERGHETSVQSVFIGPTVDQHVPIWIIIVAVLGGILLLVLLVFTLFKLGFFKREKKLLLEEERNAMENDCTEPMTGNIARGDEDDP